jgi:hypothetical protein
MRADFVSGLIFVALAIVIYSVNWQTSYPPILGDPGSLVLPSAIAFAMACLGTLVAARSLLQLRASRRVDGDQVLNDGARRRAADRATLFSGFLTVLALLGYVLLLPYLGYFFATLIFFTSASWALGTHSWRATAGYLCGGFVVALVTYYALSRGLNILLPRGSLIIFLERLHA